MSVILPNIGVTSCSRALALLKNCTEHIVGSFWVMAGYGFDTNNIPDWWVDIVLEENQAQTIIKAYEQGAFDGDHKNPLYLGFCIIVVADTSNPTALSYVIQHLRMCTWEGISLLQVMAEHNIPAHTEVSYPPTYLSMRLKGESTSYKFYENISRWNTQFWEDYCNYLIAEHGESMLEKYWQKSRG